MLVANRGHGSVRSANRHVEQSDIQATESDVAFNSSLRMVSALCQKWSGATWFSNRIRFHCDCAVSKYRGFLKRKQLKYYSELPWKL